MKHRMAVSTILMMAAFALVQVARAEEPKPAKVKDPAQLRRIEELERASLNRELAAAKQYDQHQSCIEQAQTLRSTDYGSDKERRENFNKAGDLEKTAGDVAGTAVANYDKAADNWTSLAKEYEQLGDLKAKAETEEMSATARASARTAMEGAAKAYELAAEAFGTANADQSPKASAASEKAATWRENLAARR